MRHARAPLLGSTSFRKQLSITLSVGVVALSLTASLTTAWVASKQARSMLGAQGMQVTEGLARESVLGLLYGSADNAADSIAATLAFPDVQRVGVFDRDGKALIVKGPAFPGRVLDRLRNLQGAPQLLLETGETWFFAAPVYTRAAHGGEGESPFVSAAPAEWLGYACVGMSKDSLRAIQASIFFNNISISLFFAVVLLVLLNLGVRRLTRPLSDLSAVMRRTEEGGVGAYAEVLGPREVMDMAQAFNRMMATLEERDRRLRQHKEALESEVALRTQELVQARDAALTASRHKSEFLANMSHELRTPMNAIIGYTEMVMEDMQVEGRIEVVQDLERVLNAAHHLLVLINNVLDLAKIEAGRMDLHIDRVRIEDIVHHVIDTVRPMMLKNSNRLEVSCEAGDREIVTDSGKLQQILLNILSNAAKFTKNGEVTMSVSLTDDFLRVTVKDTGVGMSAEQQEHIFEEFRQGDMSSTRSYEGTGLGLAITRRFCDLLGGSIEVESYLGKGSTFSVRIPLVVHVAPALSEPLTSSLPTPTPLPEFRERPSILVVDDDSAFLGLLTRTLEQAGYQVYTAANGSEAIIRARAIHPMAITLDLQMPESDGWSVLQTLQQDTVLREIPIIVISVLDAKAETLSRGASDYLAKPLQRAKLLAAVERIRESIH